jgi:glycosyltransferase involved in cell wall biosynthesis
MLPYDEASQSGVAASAYAAGCPVVPTPIGGLVEQVTPNQTGIVARDMSAEALADAVLEFVENPDLLNRCAAGATCWVWRYSVFGSCLSGISWGLNETSDPLPVPAR